MTLFLLYSCLCAQLDKGFGSLRNCNKISDKDLLDGFLGVEFTFTTLS